MRVKEKFHSFPIQKPSGRGWSKSSLTSHAPGCRGAIRCRGCSIRGMISAMDLPDRVSRRPDSLRARSRSSSTLGFTVSSSIVFMQFNVVPDYSIGKQKVEVTKSKAEITKAKAEIGKAES